MNLPRVIAWSVCLALASGRVAYAASNLNAAGADLDTLYTFNVGGTTTPALTGFKAAGTDINTRYYPLVNGGSARANIGMIAASGQDLSQIFAAKGTVYVQGTSYPFTYTGANQTWTVPAGVTKITVKVWGAGGGNGFISTAGTGGFSKMDVAVSPGQTITIMVGQGGSYMGTNTYGGGAGHGYNGQGNGGGRSEVSGTGWRIVAGGGGGSGDANGSGGSSTGGNGGGANQNGTNGGSTTNGQGGGGGTTTAGGYSGKNWGINYTDPAGAGTANNGGDWSFVVGQAPGGGGGGYYGGGGGGGNGAGGGGGSGYATGGTNVFGNTGRYTADSEYNGTASAVQNPGYVVIDTWTLLP
ncbi:MAG: hypothetical protein PHE83_16580 [Opitutaceae bacterium]|nr:hypothetical protein [Opitutaceae bacterium]